MPEAVNVSLIPIFFTLLPLTSIILYLLRARPLSFIVLGLGGLASSIILLHIGEPAQLFVVSSLVIIASSILVDSKVSENLLVLSILAAVAGALGYSTSTPPSSLLVYLLLASAYIASYTLMLMMHYRLWGSSVLLLVVLALTLLSWGISSTIYTMNIGPEGVAYTLFQASAVMISVILIAYRGSAPPWLPLVGSSAIITALMMDSSGTLARGVLGSNTYSPLILLIVPFLAYQTLLSHNSAVDTELERLKGVRRPALYASIISLLMVLTGYIYLITGHMIAGAMNFTIWKLILILSPIVPLAHIFEYTKPGPATLMGIIIIAVIAYWAGSRLYGQAPEVAGALSAWLLLILIHAISSRRIMYPAITAAVLLALAVVPFTMEPSLQSDTIKVSIPSFMGAESRGSGISGTTIALKLNSVEWPSECVVFDTTLYVYVDESKPMAFKLKLTPGKSSNSIYTIRGFNVIHIEVTPSEELQATAISLCDYAYVTSSIPEYK
ncbi:MAG: hypothetical protein F7B95_01150, partial [Desulfurococcales archaeon]|nr:hypothetical protein [Desulfurococcales archaeon]